MSDAAANASGFTVDTARTSPGRTVIPATDAPSEVLVLGCAPGLFESVPGVFRSAETDLPHARWVALSAEQAPASAEARPLYIRDAAAVVPRLPPNPLHRPGNGP